MKEEIKNAAKNISLGGLGGVGVFLTLLYTHVDKRTEAATQLTETKIKAVYQFIEQRDVRLKRIEKRLDLMDKRLYDIYLLITKRRK